MDTSGLAESQENSTNVTTGSAEETDAQLNLYYTACEVLVAILAVVGNALVIFVFRKERRLRRRTNYYIVSLAAADLLVGLLGIPFAILASVGQPKNLHVCLFTVSLLVVLCTISIFCLVAVSVDRYWAILHPMGYSRNVRTKTALVIIGICWFAGSVVGFLPLMGWHKETVPRDVCFFLEVMDLNYLAFLYFVTIITPALLLIAFYAHIYQVVLKQLRQIVTMNPEKGSSTKGSASGGTMIRMLGVQQTNEVKATQNLAIIVLFFMICWIPLYTINCILAFKPEFKVNSTFMLCCIILSHLNSAGNPLLYAYHLRDFRAAMKNFFCNLFDHQRYCEQINRTNYNYSQYHVQLRKKSSSASTCNLTNRSKIYKTKMITQEDAVIPAGTVDPQRTIWNISEHSNSSSDSLKSLESTTQDKILMIRPATPYRPRTISEVNPAYTVTSTVVCEDSDDGFNEEETLPYHDYTLEDCELETCLSKQTKKHQIVSSYRRSLSTSSPQLSRGLFFVEGNINREHDKTVSFSLREPKTLEVCLPDEVSRKVGGFALSPFRMVNGIFRGRRELNRSLSDGGNVATPTTTTFAGNGVVKSLDGCYRS